MSAPRLAIAAILVMLAMAMAGAAFSEPDLDAADSGAEYKGKCGTGADAADWEVKGEVLTISGSGPVSKIDLTKTGWGSSGCGWTSDSSETEGPEPSVVFGEVTEVVINTSGTVEATALNGLSAATKIAFGTSHKTIEDGLYEGSEIIVEIDLKDVVSVGKNAFKGCTKINAVSETTSLTDIKEGAFNGCIALEKIDIGTTQELDRTAFEGCTELKEIKVSSANTEYCVLEGLLYTKDKATMYMCPNAKTGTITELDPAVRTINLDYADVRYVLDGAQFGYEDVEFDAKTGAKAIAVVYYKQAMKGEVGAKIDESLFSMSYQLYSGWSIDSTTAIANSDPIADASDTGLSLTVDAGNGYLVRPVGKNIVKEADLKAAGFGGWTIKQVALDASYDSDGAVTDIKSYSCTINGYSGSGDAVLSDRIYGASCDISLESGDYSRMASLTIKGDMEIGEGTFANMHSLKKVFLPSVVKVPKGAFKYCTSLEYVDLGACTEIDEYAFDGCMSLVKVRVRSASIDISDAAFNNCFGLEYIQTDYSTEIGLVVSAQVIQCDYDGAEFKYDSGTLVVIADGMKSLVCNGEEAMFYKGGMAEVKVGFVNAKIVLEPGTPSSLCLVAMETQLWEYYDSFTVESGSKIGELPAPAVSGFIFKGWFDEDGNQYTADSTIDMSVLLIAHWEMQATEDLTLTYITYMFGIAVLGSLIVLAVSKYR